MTPVRTIMSFSHEPSAKTIEALKESREEELESYDILEDFWQAMDINPNV